MIKIFVLKLWKWYKGHEGVTDAHHTKYTDAEAVATVAVDSTTIKANEIKARDGTGLKLYDDDGKGIFVEDGGYVGIGTSNPATHLEIYSATKAQFLIHGGSYGVLIFGDTSQPVDQKYFYVVSDGGSYKIGRSRDSFSGYASVFNILQNDNIILCESDGSVGIRTSTPTARLDINSNIIRVRTAKTPASAGATGNQGDWCWDATYFYVCIATNTWKRSAISTW